MFIVSTIFAVQNQLAWERMIAGCTNGAARWGRRGGLGMNAAEMNVLMVSAVGNISV